jgi:hypothetical protein
VKTKSKPKMKSFLIVAVLFLGNGVFSEDLKKGGNCKLLAGSYKGTYMDEPPTGKKLERFSKKIGHWFDLK